MFASYSPGSSLAAIQVTRCRSHAWGGQARARGFQQRVGCEELAFSGAALRIVSQRARGRPRRVDSAVVEQPFAHRKVGRDGDGEPVQLRLAGRSPSEGELRARSTPRPRARRRRPRGRDPRRRRRRPRGRLAGRPGRRGCPVAPSGSGATGRHRGRRAPRSSASLRRRSQERIRRPRVCSGRPGRRDAGTRAPAQPRRKPGGTGSGRSVFAGAVRSVARARSRYGRKLSYDQPGPHSS